MSRSTFNALLVGGLLIGATTGMAQSALVKGEGGEVRSVADIYTNNPPGSNNRTQSPPPPPPPPSESRVKSVFQLLAGKSRSA